MEAMERRPRPFKRLLSAVLKVFQKSMYSTRNGLSYERKQTPRTQVSPCKVGDTMENM